MTTPKPPDATNAPVSLRVLAGVLDALVGGAVVFDPDFRVIFWNKTMEDWTGVAASRARDADLRSILPALRQPRYELRIEEVLHGGPAVLLDSILHDDVLEGERGRETPSRTRIRVSSYYDWGARERRGLMVFDDVSVLHEVLEELRQARDDAARTASVRHEEQIALRQERDRLEASNEELQQFAYMASHDLREPLHKVRMFAGLLEDDVAELLDGEALDMVRRIGSATERLEDLLNESLALLRAGEDVDAARRVDGDGIIHDVLEDLETVIDEADAVIDVGDIPAVHADPVSVHHLVQNLVSNAMKFRHPERRCHLEIDAARGSLLGDDGDLEAVRLTFRDNGIGFDPRYASEIFKPFRRLHGRSDSYRGNGLGLAICRRIVRRNGGQMWAESRPGEGSTFHVMLPASLEAEEPIETTKAPPASAGEALEVEPMIGA